MQSAERPSSHRFAVSVVIADADHWVSRAIKVSPSDDRHRVAEHFSHRFAGIPGTPDSSRDVLIDVPAPALESKRESRTSYRARLSFAAKGAFPDFFSLQ